MDPMEIDHIVEIPDTPDRITTRREDQKYVGNPEKRERGFSVAGEMNGNYIILSPQEKSHPSQNAPIFRRAQTEKNLGLGTNGAEKMEKGKTVSSKVSDRSSNHGRSVLDLTEEKGKPRQPKPAFSHRGLRDNATEDKKEMKESTGSTLLRLRADSSNTSRNKTVLGSNITVDRGKSIALSNDPQPQQKTDRQVSLPPHIVTTSRGRGQKRLVRNGFISPHNIATRTKQSTEQGNHQTNDVEVSHDGDLVSSNTFPTISVEDIVAEERGSDRVKGKQVLVHPSSRGHNAGTIHIDSSPVKNYEEANATGNAISSSLKYSGAQGGWRATHNNDNNTDRHLYDVNGHNLWRNPNVGRFNSRQNMNRIDRRDTRSSQSSKDVHAAQVTFPEVDQLTATRPTTSTLPKRQKKRGSTSGNPNEASFNPEMIFLGSSGESSSSSRSPGLDPEVVDLLSEPRSSNRLSEGLDDNSSSDARARQVEADEMLARELQEQLYHDDYFDGRGIGEHLAWELQQEGLMHTAADNHQISHPRRFTRANSQPHSQPHQNPSNRRRAVPQVPFSNRMSQLRSRTINQSRAPMVSSTGRRPRFPVNMDINMRLDILEALEDAVGDLMDVGVANDIFHAQHDFNEDDYEMLLALDEENHQHTGASSRQINSLPQSTIQTDNFTEDCAVCLETPVKGETIRHLPCLHKFHKDCIDPWLQRKRSCPVCKSSIT